MGKTNAARQPGEAVEPHVIDRKQFRGLPAEWPGLIEEAERRGYVEFKGNKIKYRCGNTYEDNFNDPEEKVRAALYAWLILVKEYPADAIKIEVKVPRRTPSDKADIVIYADATCRTPFLVVEAKEPATTAKEFRQSIEQAFGNSNSLRDTKLTLADSGKQSALFAVAGYPQDERKENLLGERDDLPKNYGKISQLPIVAGDPDHDIKPKPPKEVEKLVRRAHGLIWAGGKRDPLTAFDEWCKLLFTKVYDERHTPNGSPRGFQGGRGEQDVAVANRVRQLYSDAQKDEPNIFTEPIRLPDDKIAQVVRTIQGVAFTQMEVDSLGDAFEHFFGTIFRGELGQYFTPREIARFVCSMLKPTDKDKVLDPAAGSGGFLLEAQIQVWHSIDENYQGQQEQDRRKYDFAHNNVFGIEIHDKLSRICQTNLILHKDGHTNVEGDRSCLDSTFQNTALHPNSPIFTVVIGNPPFGDSIKEGSRDHLGGNHLANFELALGDKVSSEIVILERAIKWLAPGKGRLGMVVPDGMLNNSGEGSRCPAFRRFLFLNTKILAIVSLPDYAFRGSGAQNKTSLLFLRRLSAAEKKQLEEAVEQYQEEIPAAGNEEDEDENQARSAQPMDIDTDKNDAEESDTGDRVILNTAISNALHDFDYPVFLAEAEYLGYTPSGGPSPSNDLYRRDGHKILATETTILGQFREFEKNPGLYESRSRPDCLAIQASDLFDATASHRIDPKYHIFKHLEEMKPPQGLEEFTLGQILDKRSEPIIPYEYPDTEFKTITLTQRGTIEPREAGKGNAPIDWHGAYFKEGTKWFQVRCGDLLISRIDLWQGCIDVVPATFDGGIVTGEFPHFFIREEYKDRVSMHYLKLLLRTAYFQRAIRAITTGHSNRRRTQPADFMALKVFLPPFPIQASIVAAIQRLESEQSAAVSQLSKKVSLLDSLLMGDITQSTIGKFLDGTGINVPQFD